MKRDMVAGLNISNLEIRRFKKDDGIAVSNIIKEANIVASRFYPKKVIKLWNNLMSSPEYIIKKSVRRTCLVAEYNRKVVGYMNLQRNVIKFLFVEVSFQGKGIGKLLVKKAMLMSKRKRHEKLLVKSNINSEGFFKSIGFNRKRIVYKKDKSITVKKILMDLSLAK